MDADALSHIPRGSMISILKLDSVCALISQAAQDTTLMEAYSCNILVTETLYVQKEPKMITVEDSVVAQSKDLAMRKINYLINNKVKWYKMYSWDPQTTKQYLR